MALMVTVSGVRGVCGSSLTPDVVTRYVGAFARVPEPRRRIVVGRDSRVSGPWVRHVVLGVLCALGCEVIDVGIVPTPTVQV